jgi:polyhydroxybutyrate depolymerase
MANAGIFDRLWGLVKLVDYKQFLLCLPNGSKNSSRVRFWNATEACCDYENTEIDDAGYLMDLVALIETNYAVDPQSIHFVGHSNGAFMSYRMACDHADKIASIACLAGATYIDADQHTPTEPVHVLHIHGSNDTTIRYDGACWGDVCYPSARESAEIWAKYNHCDMSPKQLQPIGLIGSFKSEDTEVSRYEPKLEAGTTTDLQGATVELWTIENGSHVPAFNFTYGPRVIDWLLKHRKVALSTVLDDLK